MQQQCERKGDGLNFIEIEENCELRQTRQAIADAPLCQRHKMACERADIAVELQPPQLPVRTNSKAVK